MLCKRTHNPLDYWCCLAEMGVVLHVDGVTRKVMRKEAPSFVGPEFGRDDDGQAWARAQSVDGPLARSIGESLRKTQCHKCHIKCVAIKSLGSAKMHRAEAGKRPHEQNELSDMVAERSQHREHIIGRSHYEVVLRRTHAESCFGTVYYKMSLWSTLEPWIFR